MKLISGALLLMFTAFTQNSLSQGSVITVNADKIISEISPQMWGVFFEDINFAADGGLYAELIKNRSFEFPEPMTGWKEVKEPDAAGRIILLNQERTNAANSRFLRVKLENEKGRFGICNEGFRGIGAKENEEFRFFIKARKCGDSDIRADIELLNRMGKVIGNTFLMVSEEEWTNHSVTFTSSESDAACSLRILFSGKGTADIDMISLFPADTWKQRPNGLRKDIVQMIAHMKPGFIRFPGGCIVEGHELLTRYQWKNSVGPLDQRKLQINRWNSEFKHRLTPDYYQSFGLGFYEYFLLAEDIGAEPIPVINCGMACQFNTAEVADESDVSVYVQDALDLIEFANGDVNSLWGSLRSKLGHPEPFNMKYLGIGNEQWGEQYINVYKKFADKIRSKYPSVKLVVSASPYSEGEEFEYLWREHRTLKSDIVDEHYYKNPSWFFANASRYDNYDRKGPKVFAGEYAAQSVGVCSPENKNTWLCALSEAAFMTGLERNADVVHLASYAPLLAHKDAWQWTPDLIYFDNLSCFGSANYYVQQMFSSNKGTHEIQISENGLILSGQDSIYACASIDKNKNELIIKVVNASSQSLHKEFKINGISLVDENAEVTILSNDDPGQCNTFDAPEIIRPVSSTIQTDKFNLHYLLKPYSLTIIKLKTKN